MTETLSEPPPPPARDERRLVRDPDDQVVAGVCAALGRYTDTDPVLWRVVVAVLALFGGAGLVLYVLGWLLVPRRGERQSVVERTLRRPDGVSPAGVVLLVIGAVVLLAVIDDGPGVGVLLVVGALAWLVARERRSPGTTSGAAPVPHDPPVPYDPAATYEPAPPYGTPTPWTEPPPAPRRGSPLGWLTVSAATLLAGLLLLLRALGVDGITPPRVVAAALLVVGAGLLVATWIGRARWLIAVGLLLVLALGATQAAWTAGLQDGVGEREWVATGSSTYRLGAGEAVLDLTRLEAGDEADVAARVGAGRLVVLLPEDVVARVVSDVGLGEISRVDLRGDRRRLTLDDGRRDGERGGDDLSEEFVVGGPARDATVEVDLEVGLGEIEVRRVAS